MTVRSGMLDCEIYRRRSGSYGARIGSLMDAGYHITKDADDWYSVYDHDDNRLYYGGSKIEAEQACLDDWISK